MKLTLKPYLAALLLFSLFCPALAHEAVFYVKGISSKKGLLYSLQGERSFLTDTVTSGSDGRFIYKFDPDKLHPGFYRIAFSERVWIDFIYDNEAVNIQTDAAYPGDSVKIIASESNKVYRMFSRLSREFKTKSELLNMMLLRYPQDDEFHGRIKDKLNSLKKDYNRFIADAARRHKGKYISSYVRSARLSFADSGLAPEKQLDFLKSHALDFVDFTDTRLIYSDAFTNKAIEYLTYYRNPQLNREMLEREFMAAVDSLLLKAKVNHFVYQHITSYLIGGFRKFGFDLIIDYIVTNYVIKDDICLDSQTGLSIQRRIDQNKKLTVGSSAPAIVLPDSAGRLIASKDITGKKILVLFYASWCPHCKTLLPDVWKLYNSQKEKNVEILAVSLDTDKKLWLDFVRENKFGWINVSDLKGWDGKAVSDYCIYATPSMFLLDSEGKILAKPADAGTLKNTFSLN